MELTNLVYFSKKQNCKLSSWNPSTVFFLIERTHWTIFANHIEFCRGEINKSFLFSNSSITFFLQFLGDTGNIIVRELYLRFALICFCSCICLWMEEVLCEEMGFIGLHSYWQLGLSYSLYIWMIFVMAFRGQKKEKLCEITWHFKGLVPTIIYLEGRCE